LIALGYKKSGHIILAIIGWLAITALPSTILAQGMYTPFGQNRVQHQNFIWSFVRSENYDAFFYNGGKEIAQFAARTAELHLNELERIVDHRLSGRVEIICYNSLSDYKQSNFGLAESNSNTGGYSQVSANKIFIYFNGNHGFLEQQVKAGVAMVLMNELLFGGNIQDRIQNAALLNLPDWFMFGLNLHLSSNWSTEEDNKLKDLITSRKLKKFNRLVQQDYRLAGESFWRYLNDKYGEEVVSNMLYITRLTRNYETALIYVTGENLKLASKNWLKYYKELYESEDSLRNIPNDRLKIKRRLQPYVEREMKVGPKGDKIAFTTNKYGKYKVWVINTKTGKTQKIHRGGIKYNQLEIDHSFPVLAWHPGGDKVSYIHEKKGKLFLTTVDLVHNNKRERIQLLKFDKITSFDYSVNERTLIFSAIRKGQSDIYTYDLITRKERQLTNDIYDDLYPRFTDGSSKFIFSSNRRSDSLSAPAGPVLEPDNNLDIYLYDFEGERKLKRLTYTPNINETYPVEYNRNYYSYLTDYNGIKNRYAVRIESEYDFTEMRIVYKNEDHVIDTLFYDNKPFSGNEIIFEGKKILLDSNVDHIDTLIHEKDLVYTYPLTNYKRNILSHDLSIQSQTLYEVVLDSNKFAIRYQPLLKNIPEIGRKTETFPTMSRLKSGYAIKPFKPGLIVYSHRKARQNSFEEKPVVVKPEKYDYFFVNEFTPQTLTTEDVKIVDNQKEEKTGLVKSFKLNAPRFYDVTFFPDYFVTQLDNSVINTYYQPITPGGENMFNPGLNGMFKLGLIDLMEDYRLTGGFRVALDLSGVDYFLAYEILKHRIDHMFSFYRQVREGNTEGIPVKSYSHELRYLIKYPINEVISFRLNVFGRQDRDVYKAILSNPSTVSIPDNVVNWAGGKLELVIDNTRPKGLNLYNGIRMKVFTEHYENLTDRSIQLNTFGFDVRNYFRLHRQLIWCNRVTYNTSFGVAKVKYTLGGVDNWIQPRTENVYNAPASINYAFQALATNMRGFGQSIRAGNSFAVINSEIRFPIFSYLFNRPIRSEFLNNFQLVPFFDIGTAWIGKDPYSEENIYNQKTVEVSHLKVTVVNVREPIVAGYGGGLRTKLFGYFIRFDTAWGIQDMTVNKKPVYYVSLSLDF